MEHISIVGGGLSGSLLSVFMARRGFKVDLFERRSDMRSNKISAGRSINLALSNRGINALDKVGLTEDILSDAIPMYGRMMHSRTGELNFQPYGTEQQCIYSVSRGRLNIRLLELADEYENINIHFDARCTDVDIQNATAKFEMADGSEQTFMADHIIGTDGAFAATRGRLQITDRFDYSQSYLHVGYKELCIPPGPNGEFKLEKNALHIWPRGAFMMIALPNPDGTFTCTLFLSMEGETSFANLKKPDDIIQFFEKEFPDALLLMPTLIEDFFANPTGSLVTVRCWPWAVDGKVALLGDAAHAVVPFFGQGMNCSFEDCVIMDECIEKYLPDWKNVFDQYQHLRKPNTDAIASLAVQNFYEMSDRVGDAEFLHRKHIEHDLCELYSDLFQSQYELVTFSNTPYIKALERGPINDKILSSIIEQKLEDKIKDRSIIEPVIRRFADYL